MKSQALVAAVAMLAQGTQLGAQHGQTKEVQ